MEDIELPVRHTLHNNDVEWQPLALTLVEYPKGDLLGKFFAFISLSPFGIGAGFVALILFRRDLHTIAFFLGTLVNEVLNIILKHIICEARPLARGNLYNEYGMPSSHAQFVWFFSFYVLYFVLISHPVVFIAVKLSLIIYFQGKSVVEALNKLPEQMVFGRKHKPIEKETRQIIIKNNSNKKTTRYRHNQLHHINNNSIISALWRVVIVGGCIALALLVSVGRVYLHYHTTAQVLVGAVVGFLFATVWFAIVHRVFTPLFPQLVSLKFCEMLMLRDTTLIPNVLWFEYTTSRQEARARGRKMAALKPTQ